MKLSNKYPLQCTHGPRDSSHMTGSGSGTGPLDYESRDPVPDPETLPFKYFFGQLSFYLKKKLKSILAKWLAHILASGATMSGLNPAEGEEIFWCPNMLSLVSFAGMTLSKCAVLWIGTLTGVPV